MCRRGVHIRTHDGAVASERIQSTSVRSPLHVVCLYSECDVVMACFVCLGCVNVVAYL